LSSSEDLGELVDRVAELFLKIADAVIASMACSQVRVSGERMRSLVGLINERRTHKINGRTVIDHK
jgi:hypothetical protein